MEMMVFSEDGLTSLYSRRDLHSTFRASPIARASFSEDEITFTLRDRMRGRTKTQRVYHPNGINTSNRRAGDCDGLNGTFTRDTYTDEMID